MTARIQGRLLTLMAAGVLAACASSPDNGVALADVEPEQPPTIDIQVRHNAPIALSMTIHLIEPDGITRRIGRVGPGETANLQLVAFPATGDYVLLAETPSGHTARSDPFPLLHREGVRWDLEANSITPIIESVY